MTDLKLTGKQEKFVEQYLIDFNGTQAAIRAGYSEATASEIAYENLRKPHIIEALNTRREAIVSVNDVTPERILAEYAKIGFSDIRKVLTPAGNISDPQDWDDETAGAIAGLEVVTKSSGADAPLEYVHKFKMWDKRGALDSMAKYFSMFDGKKGADDPEDSGVSSDVRSVARDVAFLLRRAVETQKAGKD